MTADEIADWKIALIEGNSSGPKQAKWAHRDIQAALASLECAYQVSMLRESMEKYFNAGLTTRNGGGRLFKDE